MAFSFGNSQGSVTGGSSSGGVLGPELEVIQTESLGFTALAGEAKVRLTTPWKDNPAPTACLLSIASRKGLVAAAGPDGLIIASTEAVRKTFETPKEGDSETRAFQPQLKIPLPMRVSQVAFTADEKHLIISAESGGGLAVYDVQNLLQGSTQTAFEIATNGEGLRALLPNPTVEKAELCAVVTNNGNLHMANLQARALSNALKAQVSSISWSTKGKQLVAGLADGTIYQMTPEGEAKAEIPKPPGVGDYHVSSLTWLENHLFLAIHTSTNESPPTSVYHVITRTPPSSFEFRKLADPVEPFGSDKIPHYMILRLKDFPPNLQDALIIASTASTDVGLLSRSKTPLAADKPAESITNVFTVTEMADDTRRATLPMTDDYQNAVPIGCSIDLSAKETVYKPIPTDEINESPGPVPGYWVLTHEGILCAWWVIYSDSIKSGATYPGMATLNASAPSPAAACSPPPALAAPALSRGSAFSGGSSSGSAFGSSTTTPAFGGASTLGSKQSPWSSAAASTGGATFGSSTFGSSAATATPAFGQPSAFGQSSGLGAKSSPWASGATSAATPAFGQSGGFGGASASKSVFGAPSESAAGTSSSGGFASFASKGGFGSLGGGGSSSGSVFGGQQASGSPFGSGSALGQSTSNDTAFPPPQKTESTGGSGGVFGGGPFKLESSFKRDPNAKDDDEKPGAGAGGSLFGGGFSSAFGSVLGDATKQPSATPSTKDEDMDAPSAAPTPPPQPRTNLFSVPSTTPTTTPAPTRLFSMDSSVPQSNIFSTTPAAPTTTSIFSSTNRTPESKQESKTTSIFNTAMTTPVAGKKESVETPKIQVANEDDIPLPPESTSKAAYPLGESSSSSGTAPDSWRKTPAAEEAPLPPDFLAAPRPTTLAVPSTKTTPVPEDAPLPPDPTKSLSKPAAAKPSPFAQPNPFSKPSPFAVPENAASGRPNPFARAVEDAPLPPDFLPKPKTKSQGDMPPPPVPEGDFDSESGRSERSYESESEPSGPSEGEYEEEEGQDGEDDEDEGSDGTGVDVAKDLSPSTTGLTRTPGLTPQSSFGGIGGSAFMVGRPNQEQPRTLFGEVGGRKAPVFPAPTSGLSPRSPSPVRPPRSLSLDASRSVSAPGMASQILGASRKPQSRLGMSIVGKPRAEEDPAVVQQRKAREKREAEETQPLVDEDDDEIQRILDSEVEGSLEIDQFIAHTDVAPPAQDNIPSQVEAMYRDINSMIDTCGLNARSAMAFVKGNMQKLKPERRTKDDLEDPEDWVLCEGDELSDIIYGELAEGLEGARVQDVEAKKEDISHLLRNMSRLRAKKHDMEIILQRFDPDMAAEQRNMPLSAEQAAQQNELRRGVAKFKKSLSEAEEALTMLKTRIASAGGASGKGGTQAPTVEAVVRTINKMTAMVEKRSGDIDVLENQMRKLRFSSTASRASREGTPVTPRKSTLANTPDTPGSRFRNSLSASVGTPTRKKLSGYSDEEKNTLMQKRAQKKAALAKLRERVVNEGVTVWAMEDVE